MAKIGKQPLYITQHEVTIVFIDDDRYYITGIRYENGKPLGFNAVKNCCDTCEHNVEYPLPHTCDICTSLDEDDYCIWIARKEA